MWQLETAALEPFTSLSAMQMLLQYNWTKDNVQMYSQFIKRLPFHILQMQNTFNIIQGGWIKCQMIQ